MSKNDRKGKRSSAAKGDALKKIDAVAGLEPAVARKVWTIRLEPFAPKCLGENSLLESW